MVAKILFIIILVCLRPALVISQNTHDYYSQGLRLKASGDIDGAIDLFEQAVKKQRDFADAHYELALCYMAKDSIKSSPTTRLRAQYALERALKIEPENTKYLLSYGELRNRQSFKYGSLKIFEDILKIDSDSPDAMFKLAESYLARSGKKTKDGRNNLESAVEVLTELIANEPDYPDVHYIFGRVYQKLQKYEMAEEEFLKQIEADNKHGSAKIQLGITYFRLDQREKATTYYLEGLEEITDLELLEELDNEFRWLLTDEEKKSYALAPLERRSNYIADFWRDRDSNVLTPVNERLIEHFRRVDYVKAQYFEINYRGFDDRGEIYLKYGEPNKKYIDIIGANESWLYDRIDYNLAYDFVSKAGVGPYRLVPDLSYVSTPPLIETARKLYIERAYLGGIYSIIGGMAFGSKVGGNVEDFQRRLSFDYQGFVTQALSEAPAQKFLLEFEEEPIDFPFSIAQFRGNNGRTEIEIYIGYPHDQFEFSGTGKGLEAHVKLQVVVLDSNFFRRAELNREKSITPDKEMSATSLSMERLGLMPGNYTFGIQQKQEEANRLGIFQPEVTVRDFDSDDLMISDIRISNEPRQENFRETDSREKLTMLPYPFLYVNKSEPLLIYFEIYNLSFNNSNSTQYSVEYSIRPTEIQTVGVASGLFKKIGELLKKDEQQYITISEERSGKNQEVHNLIALDVTSLRETEITISITVLDKVRKSRTVSSRDIRIIK